MEKLSHPANNQTNNSLQALWVGMGSFSSFALAIVSTAILSRYFDKTEYGTYRQIIYVYSTLLVIFSAGLPSVFAYFLPRYNLNQGKEIVWMITKVLFLTGLAFSIFLFIFSDIIANILKNPELAIGLKYFSPIPMLLLPTLGIEGIFSTYKKTIYIAIYDTTTRLLMLLFIVLPVIIFKGTYIYAIYGWIIVSVISLFLAYYFKGIPFKNIKSKKADLNLKQVFAYSIPIVAASLAGIAIKASDQFYISRYFGTVVFAEFSNGFIDLPFVSMVTSATGTVLMPIFAKIIFDKSEINNLVNMWQSAIIKSAIIIYPLVVFFIFYAKEVVILLYSIKYTNSVIYFQIAMAVNFFNIIIFSPLLFALGKTRFYATVHIILAICVWAISFILVILFKSPIIIAIFSVTLAIVKILIFLYYSSRLIKVSFFRLFPVKNIFILILHSILVITMISLIMSHLLKQLGLFTELTLSFIVYLVLLVITARFFKINYALVYKPVSNYIKLKLLKK